MKKVLLLSDLHGKLPEIAEKNFDFILCAGDLGDDSLIKDKMFEWLNSSLEIPFSQYVEEDLVIRDLARKEESYRRIFSKLDSFGVPVFVVPGNDDMLTHSFFNGFLDMVPYFGNIRLVHHKAVYFDDFMVVGYGNSNSPEYIVHEEDRKEIPLRFHSRIKLEYLRIKRVQEELFMKGRDRKRVIYLTHNVPFGIMDRITYDKSPKKGLNYGSLVVKNLALKHKPLLVHSGHMHEYQGHDFLENTLCVNSGYSREGKYSVLEIGEDGVSVVRFYQDRELVGKEYFRR